MDMSVFFVKKKKKRISLEAGIIWESERLFRGLFGLIWYLEPILAQGQRVAELSCSFLIKEVYNLTLPKYISKQWKECSSL